MIRSGLVGIRKFFRNGNLNGLLGARQHGIKGLERSSTLIKNNEKREEIMFGLAYVRFVS